MKKQIIGILICILLILTVVLPVTRTISICEKILPEEQAVLNKLSNTLSNRSVKVIEKYDNYNNSGLFWLDRTYHFQNSFPATNTKDNDDAGYKKDAGNEIIKSLAIYPGELIDEWPGRGRTGKLSSSDDEDWYVFSVCKGQTIILTMVPPSGFNYDISLWDENKIERDTSTNSGSSQESITFSADITGYWYLQVFYISGAGEGQYSFNVTLSGQNDANTGKDAGDTFAMATQITTGSYEGYLEMNDEEDWYKFNIDAGQNIHFKLLVYNYALFSDFDIYLYNPNGSLMLAKNDYYDDTLLYPIDESGFWRVRIKIFPGYTDIPQPTEWEYYTYGSGVYKLQFKLESTVPDPQNPIPQPQITPIAQIFKIVNDPDSNKDEYRYLASIPACNYLDGGERYLAPIVYTGDKTRTNWFGTVDNTTNYLLDDWNTYLSKHGKTALQYNIPSDPIQAAAEIALQNWPSSNLAVVTVDGSGYTDTTSQVLHETKTLIRHSKVKTIPNDSNKIRKMGSSYIYPMIISSKWGAINVSIYGPIIPGGGIFHVYPSLIQLYPKFMSLTSDWWPEYPDVPRYDIYYPVTTPGLWAAGVKAPLGDWDFIITRYECDRYTIKVNEDDASLKATVKTSTPSDLLVFLIDPQGHIRAPDIPAWNGGPILPIHEWHGIDDDDPATPCNPWRNWNPEPHTEFIAEVLHPEKGTWTAIVVPRNAHASSSITYTISAELKKLNQKRVNAALSGANAAVIASQEHVPLLYVKENNVPTETKNAFNTLGIDKVIFVENGGIGTAVKSSLPELEADLTTMQEIIDYIKGYPSSENYITITSLKTGEGYFAPSAMLAAYHGSPVLRLGEAKSATSPVPLNDNKFSNQKNQKVIGAIGTLLRKFLQSKPTTIEESISLVRSAESPNPTGMANRIDTWRLWAGDYYHGNRAPGHLPRYKEPIEKISNFRLLIELIKYLISGNRSNLPPLGMDAKRYWNEEMYKGIHKWITDYGLDREEEEAFAFVAPRRDIRLEIHSVMMGNNSYSGHVPGETPAYTSDIIVRNILYPALIYANPNRDVTSTQFMNYPDGEPWMTNDGVTHQVKSSQVLKNVFMSHGRTYDGHCLWDAHLNRLNEGASVLYYSGHGTGGSGISAQYLQTNHSNYPDQIWPDAWRGYMYDNWRTARDNGKRWYNPVAPNLYDFIHFKWIDKLLDNLKSNAIFYMSCSTGQHYGPLVYLDHGAVLWYGNAATGLCPEGDLMDSCFFEDAMIHGESIGKAYSKYVWLHYRDFTTGDHAAMYGPSTRKGVTTINCIYGDPNLIIYSPEWILPEPVDSPLEI